MGEIFAVFLFPEAFGLHFLFVRPDFGRDAGAFQRLTLFALVDAGTEDVDDFRLVRFLILLFAAQNERVRGRTETETAGAAFGSFSSGTGFAVPEKICEKTVFPLDFSRRGIILLMNHAELSAGDSDRRLRRPLPDKGKEGGKRGRRGIAARAGE